MRDVSPHIVLCNGAEPPEQLDQFKFIKLEYQESIGNSRNVNLALPNFVLDVFHLSDRILDLLEIAAYVYCADRLISRGSKNNIEYHSWSRLFHFIIKSLFEKSFDTVSHQVNGSDVHHSLSSPRIAFIIQSQSTEPTKPRKCAFNNPS